jgi:hypothetical protein
VLLGAPQPRRAPACSKAGALRCVSVARAFTREGIHAARCAKPREPSAFAQTAVIQADEGRESVASTAETNGISGLLRVESPKPPQSAAVSWLACSSCRGLSNLRPPRYIGASLTMDRPPLRPPRPRRPRSPIKRQLDGRTPKNRLYERSGVLGVESAASSLRKPLRATAPDQTPGR